MDLFRRRSDLLSRLLLCRPVNEGRRKTNLPDRGFSQRCEKRSRIRVWQIDRRFISFAAVLISFFAIIHIAASASEMTTVILFAVLSGECKARRTLESTLIGRC
jgi:hypothetical protein